MNSESFEVLNEHVKNKKAGSIDTSWKKTTLANIFGISLNEHLALEFADCPDVIPTLQTVIDEIGDDILNDKVQLRLFLDDVLQKILRTLRPSLCSKSSQQEFFKNSLSSSMGTLFNHIFFDNIESSKSYLILQYFQNAEKRCDIDISNKSFSEENEFLVACKTRINVCAILFLRGLTHADVNHDDIVCCVTKMLLQNQFNAAYFLTNVVEFMNKGIIDFDALSEVFNPIFSKLRYCLIVINVNDKFNLLTDLLLKTIFSLISLQVNGKRLLADLLVSRTDFCPEVFSEQAGREFVRRSYLGPVLSMSTVGNDDEEPVLKIVEQYFSSTTMWRDQQRFLQYSSLQSRINSFRLEMHSILHLLLVNSTSRVSTLNFLSQLLGLNRKRAQIHSIRSQLASSGVMLNVLSVMLYLSEKIMLDKVQDHYIFHPKNKISIKDDARISFPPDVVDSIEAEVDLNFDPKFTTECFYLTIYALHIGMNSAIEYFSQLKAHFREVRTTIHDLQELIKKKGDAYGRHPVVLNRIKQAKIVEKRLMVNHMCHECILKDENLIMRCVKFANIQLALVLRSVSPDFINNALPPVPPKIFGTLPEIFVESALDFIVFALRESPSIFLLNPGSFAEQLLVLSCCLNFFKNPYLASKVVNVVFLVSPLVNPSADVFFHQIVDNAFASQLLFSSLSKFYANVESTGANTEFYDKFNIRRSIQVIFKSMWKYLIHRNSMIEVAENQSPEFVRFINMVINDATFLLDESLTGLRKIRDIEALIDNEGEFNALSEEDRNQKRSALSEVQRSVRTWLILCNDTMEFFILLTTDNPQIFLDTLGDRVAAMLNYNVVQLCGPKCSELKVKDAKTRFEWDPRKLLEQIVTVYLNLSSKDFAESIAQDERSYTPEAFLAILEKMVHKRILEMSHTERFRNLMEMAERYYKEKTQQELDFGDDIPDEFKDQLVYTIMSDPMRLPSGQVVDKKHILRHLLSDKTNPFTRQPLTIEELVPDVELKRQIENWIDEKKKSIAQK